MKFHYYEETDPLYIDLSSRTSIDSNEVSDDVVIDYADDGQIVGTDIQQASKVGSSIKCRIITHCDETILNFFYLRK